MEAVWKKPVWNVAYPKKLAVKFPDSHGLGLKNTKIRYVTPKVSKFAELPSPMAN